MKSYASIKSIDASKPAGRQYAKRHCSIPPIFCTRHSRNVIRNYIRHYSSECEALFKDELGRGIYSADYQFRGCSTKAPKELN